MRNNNKKNNFKNKLIALIMIYNLKNKFKLNLNVTNKIEFYLIVNLIVIINPQKQ